MPRIFKGSESTLRLLIHKCNHYNSISDLKIVLFTGEDIDNHIEVVDGINVDGNMAVITLPARAFNNLEEGVINYIVEGVIDGDLFATERQSNYYLKTPLSYVVDDSLQIKDEYITENGNYTIYPDETYDGMSQVNLFVEVPDTNGSYDEGYNIGRGEGYNDGYANGQNDGYNDGYTNGQNDGYNNGYTNGQNDGYNSGREEVISQAESLYLTENGVYEGENLYNRVEVAVDVEEPYNKGYEDGANAASADAIVLDVTENGIYCSKYAELPEWNEPLTGDDFYSYAYLKGIEFDTNYTWQMDTEIEVWFMYNETFQPNQYYPPVIIGNSSYGAIRWNRDDKTNRTWEFYSASSTLFTLEPNVWHKIKLSITDGLWVDDEFIGKVVLNNVHIGRTISISDSRGGSNWYFGMVKINGDIWYPTPFGFKNNNDDALTGDSSKIEYFKKQTPIVVDNLVKQVNVDVPILLGSTKIRFTNSPFTKIPKVKSDGLTDMREMFKGCAYVTDASALADLDTKYVTTLQGCFNGFGGAGLDLSPISNWDVSNVTNLDSLFMSGNRFEDYSFMANWNTSNVVTFQSLFYTSNGSGQIARYIPIIKADNATILSMIFSNDTQPTTSLEYFGGFQNMKCNWNDNRGLSATPNLTYESCISILNCLYNFTENGETPTSSQGKLKVHQNFLDLVGDEISIGTNKGWTITA